MGNTGWSEGDHLHFCLYYNGECLSTVQNSKPEPISGYTDIAYDQLLISNNTGQTYICSWRTQDPDNVVEMLPGESRTFIVSYENTGNATWENSGGMNNLDYIELRSCDASGNIANSWLYPGSGWINAQRVVFPFYNNVQTGQNAWFQFTGKVPIDAASGYYQIYFRQYHTTGGYIDNWGGMNFHIRVVTPSEPNTFDDIATMYNYPGNLTSTHVWTSDGDRFNCNGGSQGWWRSSSWSGQNIRHVVSGDFDGDGLSDVADIYDYGIVNGKHHTRAHVFLSTGSSFSLSGGSQGWWKSPGNYDADRIVFAEAGDFSGDGKDDIVLVYNGGLNKTRIHLLISTGSSFLFYYAWSSNSYNAQSVVGAAAGHFNTGSRCDLALVYDYPGALTRIHMFSSNGLSFSLSGGSQGWWRSSSWPTQNMIQVEAGDFDNDGLDDIVDVYNYPNGHTRLHVWRSTGTSFTLSGGSNGWWRRGSYTATKVKQAATGDFDGDGDCDVVLAYKYSLRQVRYHVFLSSRSSFVYQGDAGWWRGTSYEIDCVRGMVAGNFNGTGAAKVAEQWLEEIHESLPTTVTLNQNYPNPFNPTTTVSYTLPVSSHVTLDIFNFLGQKIETLINKHQNAGQHEISWVADQQAYGIYFYRISAGDATETKKMVLLR